MIEIPTIQTERLILSPPTPEDFEGYKTIACTDRGIGFGGPMSEHDAWLDFAQMAAGWVLFGFGSLSVRLSDDLTYLGTVVVNHEFGDPEPELGVLLIAEAEGRGIAFEAASAMKDWAFGVAGFSTLVSYTSPENIRAHRLVERLGGVRENGPPGATTFRYRPGD